MKSYSRRSKANQRSKSNGGRNKKRKVVNLHGCMTKQRVAEGYNGVQTRKCKMVAKRGKLGDTNDKKGANRGRTVAKEDNMATKKDKVSTKKRNTVAAIKDKTIATKVKVTSRRPRRKSKITRASTTAPVNIKHRQKQDRAEQHQSRRRDKNERRDIVDRRRRLSNTSASSSKNHSSIVTSSGCSHWSDDTHSQDVSAEGGTGQDASKFPRDDVVMLDTTSTSVNQPSQMFTFRPPLNPRDHHAYRNRDGNEDQNEDRDQEDRILSSRLQWDSGQKLILVVDTNVLISDLKRLQYWLTAGVPGYGTPVLVLPWVVVQELDYIKDSERRQGSRYDRMTCAKSRDAIRFIHGRLRAGDPHVTGQRPQDSYREIIGFPVQNNDDRILACCLQCMEKKKHNEEVLDQKRRVILVTHDVNLANKSIIMGIETASTQVICAMECATRSCIC